MVQTHRHIQCTYQINVIKQKCKVNNIIFKAISCKTYA